MAKIIGTCSICNGKVVQHSENCIQCSDCGAVPKEPHGPIIPMKPRPLDFLKPYDTWPNNSDYCYHENCEGCKNGTCNGIHWISCPCRKCSPWC